MSGKDSGVVRSRCCEKPGHGWPFGAIALLVGGVLAVFLPQLMLGGAFLIATLGIGRWRCAQRRMRVRHRRRIPLVGTVIAALRTRHYLPSLPGEAFNPRPPQFGATMA